MYELILIVMAMCFMKQKEKMMEKMIEVLVPNGVD